MADAIHHVRVRPVGDRRTARGFALHPEGDQNRIRVGVSRVWWERIQGLGAGSRVVIEPNGGEGIEGGLFEVLAVEAPSDRGGFAASVAVIAARVPPEARAGRWPDQGFEHRPD